MWINVQRRPPPDPWTTLRTHQAWPVTLGLPLWYLCHLCPINGEFHKDRDQVSLIFMTLKDLN